MITRGADGRKPIAARHDEDAIARAVRDLMQEDEERGAQLARQ